MFRISVILKWYLPDEQYGSKALGLLDQYISEFLDITGPTLLEYEFINGIAIARRSGRLEEGSVITAMEGFLNLEIILIDPSKLYKRILYYCHTFNRSANDASYLSLAGKEGIGLFTADERPIQQRKERS